MNPFNPIYTEKTECQDCYKCVRECPVKAIQVKDGHAEVIDADCILCGHCVTVCPMQAKKVRFDLERVKQLLLRKEKVIVSLAPSYKSEFLGVSESQMISALKKLGFYAVSETALGAQIVSAHVAEIIEQKGPGVYISSACPVVVDYIKKYKTEHVEDVLEVFSPVLAHCQYLRQIHGKDCRIVFISPCIAKKKEADTYADLLNVALTFKDLREWLIAENIAPETMPNKKKDQFFPHKSLEGALYPVDGGMIAGIKAVMDKPDNVFFMAVSGMQNITQTLTDIEVLKNKRPIFLETLACEGGCINGPTVKQRAATGVKRYTVIQSCDYHNQKIERNLLIPDITMPIEPCKKFLSEFSDEQVREVLNQLGKYTDHDELNCSGCGYDSCKDLVQAYLNGRAEKTMCVSYMRKLAQKKASALLSAMPSGVVIVNSKCQVIECNRQFAQLMGDDLVKIYDDLGNLDSANINKITPFGSLFQRVLESEADIINREYRGVNIIYHISIFTIEPKTIVGGIIQDITKPAGQKEHIVRKSQEVIKKQLATVQKIAYLLGENAAESEVLLDSIIKSFTLEKADE
ncbi:MAG: PAS domain-containing protein [Candidatus Omnitrophica bacterium]|nr:PAS domain-containing protein [Candidatus Omnitrophota bacterium]